jgi:hypothetical protein
MTTMPTLSDYDHFAGRHWETGSVHNYFAYHGVKAPHTGQPYSEALLMGISGGLLMGYFSFAYTGHDPHVALLTRNTFNPLDTLLTRLGVVQHLQHTTDGKKAVRYLTEALEESTPTIVWADAFSLPYTGLGPRQDYWAVFPILVFGYDEDADAVSIADRAAVPLKVTTSELAAARGRIKKDKHRLLTMDPPEASKLPIAVQQGIWDCLKRYTEAPVKNAAKNFGLAAFQRWAEVLTNPKDKQSWAKVFPPGVAMYSGLLSAYDRLGLGTLTAETDRDLYAGFLEEAAQILNRPALKQAAEQFRTAARGWGVLSLTLLPDRIKPFKQTRELLQRRRQLFVGKGNAALKERQKINAQLEAIRETMKTDFPLSDSEAATFREQLAEHVLKVGELERAAHATLQAAMANGRQK